MPRSVVLKNCRLASTREKKKDVRTYRKRGTPDLNSGSLRDVFVAVLAFNGLGGVESQMLAVCLTVRVVSVLKGKVEEKRHGLVRLNKVQRRLGSDSRDERKE